MQKKFKQLVLRLNIWNHALPDWLLSIDISEYQFLEAHVQPLIR